MKKQKGITLVALIITIIVMVILAGVIIASAVADGGIIDRAQEAMKEKERAEAEELVIASYVYKTTASMTTVGTLDLNATADAIYENLTSNGFALMDGNTQASSGSDILEADKIKLDIVGKHGNYGGTVTDKGLENGLHIKDDIIIGNTNPPEESGEGNFAKFMENPEAFVHPDQATTNKDRAIGTDGTAVNMDWWKYTIISEVDKTIHLYDSESYVANTYRGGFTDGGSIKGSVPQYIKVEGKEGIFTVTSMYQTFKNYKELMVAPEIPNTVTRGESMFYGCTSLVNAPVLPKGLTNLESMFYGCTNLLKGPEIFEGVTNTSSMFDQCTSLVEAPSIPSSVTQATYMFAGCTSLVNAPEIKEGIDMCDGMFCNCSSLERAPEIPSSVVFARLMFANCTSLTGNIVIKSSGITSYYGWSFGTNPITIEVPANSTTYSNFINEYGSTPGITIEQY